MKNKFSNVDISALLPELNHKLKGLRVNQVYDVDHRTYLIRFNTVTTIDAVEDVESGNKIVLILESGSRIHTTNFQWPKSMTPSGFTMKLRKHLRNKRLEYIKQLGADRIIDLQFGSGEAAYHIILELYDRGNIIITDYEWVILNILRPRTESGEDSDVKFAVREKYPKHLAKTAGDYKVPDRNEVLRLISSAKAGDNLKKVFVPKLMFGPALIEHCFIEVGLPENAKIRDLNPEAGADVILNAIRKAEEIFTHITTNTVNPGFVTYSEERKQMRGLNPKDMDEVAEVVDQEFREFHPFLFNQLKSIERVESDQSNTACEKKMLLMKSFESFDDSLDFFFSSIKGQKLDSRQRHLEKEALMKLERVRLDHEQRLEQLARNQQRDEKKADLILMNSDIVEAALTFVRNELQKKTPWPEIESMIKEKASENEILGKIRRIDLAKNVFDIELCDPFASEEGVPPAEKEILTIDIDLSSYANARKYHDHRKVAATKEEKTIKSSEKAFKSARVKTQMALQEVAVKTSIQKSRKVYWFEKVSAFCEFMTRIIML